MLRTLVRIYSCFSARVAICFSVVSSFFFLSMDYVVSSVRIFLFVMADSESGPVIFLTIARISSEFSFWILHFSFSRQIFSA